MAKHGTRPNNMPELPEVQTVITVLKPIVIGHKITKIDVLRASTIQTDVNEFVNTLEELIKFTHTLVFNFLPRDVSFLKARILNL